MENHVIKSLLEAQSSLDALISNNATHLSITRAADIIINAFENKKRVFACGNGGSMCDAMHFAEELTGRYRKNRNGFAATSISDPCHLTCIANDFGYENVFSRYLESHGSAGDVLVAISTSGESQSVLYAAKASKSLGISVISLTGRLGSNLEKLSDICLCTPGGEFSDRVQELHIKVLHILIELIERKFYPENYEPN